MIRAQELNRDQALDVIRKCFWDLDTPSKAQFKAATSEPDLDAQEQRFMSEEYVTHLERQIRAGRPSEQMRVSVTALLAHHGVTITLDDPASDFLLTGVLRALAEEQRLFQYRLGERHLSYQPRDPLFEAPLPRPQSSEPAIRSPAKKVATHLAVGHHVDRYLETMRSSWTPKTYQLKRQKPALLVDHLGGDADIRAVAAKDIAAYRDGLARLKLGHQIGPDKSFAARQTDDAGRRISSETVAVVLANVKSFFKWLVPEVLDSNPAQGISVTKPKCMKGVKKRRPFRADELETLFGSPLFTGCKSPKRRFEPGSHRVSDAYFWLPILAFYTGARIGELIQLHMSDVDVDCGLPHLWIREEGGGALGSGTEKHVKTEAGIRQVPLHPDVLALGFGKFVEQRRKQHGKRQRLFFEVNLGADGQASSVFSKWFARLLDKVGLKDPALVCHSFRHGMEDALRDTLAPQYLIDSIIGHTEGKTSDGYGDGPALEVCAELTS